MDGGELQALTAAVRRSDPQGAAACIRRLAPSIATTLPESWLAANIHALERGNFDGLSTLFARRELAGPCGHFLIVAPFALRRSTGDVCTLSLLYGQFLGDKPMAGIGPALESIQSAELRQPINPMVPIRVLAAAGGICGTSFVVSDGWCWRDSALGPALTAVSDQRDCFNAFGQRCIRTVFDADTADLVVEPLVRQAVGERVHTRSYEIHDAAHATGIGLAQKIRDNLLPGYWYRGVEEWRADGIAFEASRRLLSPPEVADDLASNLCVRFGLDVPRASAGIDGSDEHLPSSLLLLDRMLRHGLMTIRRGRLALADVSAKGLVDAFEPHRAEAVELTRRELQLEQSAGVMRLYGSLEVHRASEAILEGLIREPCRGLYDQSHDRGAE
jgi:hypothetical protein